MILYVVPVNDLVEHEDDWCVCGPDVEQVNGALIITHHSLDGREIRAASATFHPPV